MLNDNFYENLGINIKKRRKELNLSQQQLADRCNLSLNFIGKIEVSYSKPSLDSVVDIAEALEIPINDFFTLEMDYLKKSNR